MSEEMICVVRAAEGDDDSILCYQAFIKADEPHDDYDEDEDEDEEDEGGCEKSFPVYEEKDDDEEVKDDVDDISKLDPDDARLFPNTSDDYDDSIKWLIKLRAQIEPLDCDDKPPVIALGADPTCQETPVYNNCNALMTSGKIEIGQELDVVSLLTSCPRLLRVGAAAHHYIKPKTLINKYVLLVCVFAPSTWHDCDSKHLCQLTTFSEQLSEAQNFEMVIIPKMRKNYDTSKPAFDKLLSAFRGCLFVPFEYKDARDQICQHLNFRGTLETILVDPTHKVAQDWVCDIVANRYYPVGKNKTKLQHLSSDWIRPSTRLQEIRQNYLSSSSSLTRLLDSSYADPTLRLHNLSSTETITVGQLNNKLVGLYIFQLGDKLKSLLNVYQQCREKGLDFHIVVVCLSLFITVDPLVFHRVAIGELQRLIPNTPWWVLPYNVATYATLCNLTMVVGGDAMITIGPSRNFFVDVHGGDIVHRYGIQAYPFNREMIVRKYELGAKAITLDSLLSHGRVNYVFRGHKRVPVADLYDKVVVLYTDFELEYDGYTYKCLSKWYNEIRKLYLDFEVVFVYYAQPENNRIEMLSSPDIEFLVRPFDPKHSEFFRDHKSFFMGDNGHGYPLEGLRPDSTLLFGKGGHLCSLDAVGRFEKYRLDAYPYRSGCGDNYIRDEIIKSLGSEFYFMRSYGVEKPYDVVSLDRRSTRGK